MKTGVTNSTAISTNELRQRILTLTEENIKFYKARLAKNEADQIAIAKLEGQQQYKNKLEKLLEEDKN